MSDKPDIREETKILDAFTAKDLKVFVRNHIKAGWFTRKAPYQDKSGNWHQLVWRIVR